MIFGLPCSFVAEPQTLNNPKTKISRYKPKILSPINLDSHTVKSHVFKAHVNIPLTATFDLAITFSTGPAARAEKCLRA